ncbi:hypothetical protein ACFWR9_40600, partial [Streptomyces sp. NPDC058534]
MLKRIRFPYLRRSAPDVLATARSQRRDPAEVVRVLLEVEIKGCDEDPRRNHRKQGLQLLGLSLKQAEQRYLSDVWLIRRISGQV